MTYSPVGFTNEVLAASPAKYILTDDELGVVAASATIELVTSVTPGTALDATNMNHIEDGIVAVEAKADAAQAQVDTGIPKVFTAKGQIAVATASNAMTPLTVGANGRVLQADSAQASGVKWADGYPGQITAKGDLLIGTAADTGARLAVGATGTYLIPDSGETTGLKWAAMITTGAWTSTSWDGDSKTADTTYTLTMATDFSGVPNTAKMVLAYLEASWSSVDDDSEIWITTNATPASAPLNRHLSIHGQVNNRSVSACGWVPITSAGRFYLRTGATAPQAVNMSINAYML